MKFFRKWFKTKHQRDIKRMWPLVERINAYDEEFRALSDTDLVAKTDEYRSRYQNGESLDDLLCEAYATVKNAARRLCGQPMTVCGEQTEWNMVPYDVQLIGGIVLHQGKIAEMQTGEGKTLVATLPLYLNALSGQNVHLVTTNDYLARRDAEWMGFLLRFLGMTVGCIQSQMPFNLRREQYACDITYGMNSEFGFDYLRDNGMACHVESMVQRGHHFAIVDEVDSILIDEARTPLIISGPAPVSSHQYFELKPKVERLVRRQRDLCNRLAEETRKHLEDGEIETAQAKLYQIHHGMPKHKQLLHLLEEPSVRKLHEQIETMMLTDMRKQQAHELREELYFTIDERGHDANLTDKGCAELDPHHPDTYVVPDLVTAMAEIAADREADATAKDMKRTEVQQLFADRSEVIHNVDQLIRAYCLYERDEQYVVQDNQVIIVDEFTGRLMPGRRWSDGLHQAVEAKEEVKIERETQTLATITIQNYFRLYAKLAGMTGTAETEASEFGAIYKLDVVVIPTNRPVRRIDYNDVIYKTQREKFNAVIAAIQDYHQRGFPILVGTASVDTSQVLSRMLRRVNIPHNVLNAKNHQREAEIIARAGHAGTVTIATNMAGRGTDIKLGEGVVRIPREIVTSQQKLDERNRTDGAETLRESLTKNPCGLIVIGSERHEARRIDRQLRGRCARQGDPGASRFFISLEDDLMRLFGSDRIAGVMTRLGMQEGEPLEHRWLNRSIETAQRRVEQQHFAVRKRTLEYDDVMNKQREIIYGFRNEVIRSANVKEIVLDVIHDVVTSRAAELLTDGHADGIRAYIEWLHATFPVAVRREDVEQRARDPEAAGLWVYDQLARGYELRLKLQETPQMLEIERQIVLHHIDEHWQEYLRSMDALRQNVGLRAYGQRDPLVEYKKEAFDLFSELMGAIKLDVATSAFKTLAPMLSFGEFVKTLPRGMTARHPSAPSISAPTPTESSFDAAADGLSEDDADQLFALMDDHTPFRRDEPKIGRNDQCPCGSGKKYKKCCGA